MVTKHELEQYLPEKLVLNLGIIKAEWVIDDSEKQLAWEIYIELITRTISQPLGHDQGDEKAALTSFYHLFTSSRDMIKKYGRKAPISSYIAIYFLNQELRDFTSDWHKKSENNAFEDASQQQEFRQQLKEKQRMVRRYTGAFMRIAGVPDMDRCDDPLT